LHASQGGKGANLAVGCWTVLSAQSDTRSGIPSTPVKALDATGAGDCFVGPLAAAMERGLENEPAMPPRGGEYGVYAGRHRTELTDRKGNRFNVG
jgi:fructose-1-phosphate kinase PfkB-like protein